LAASDELTKNLYTLIPFLQQRDAENAQIPQGKKKGSKTNTHKVSMPSKITFEISKELRMIPQIIYLIEQYDRSIIQLDKKTSVRHCLNIHFL
jgi:hypothetical protein